MIDKDKFRVSHLVELLNNINLGVPSAKLAVKDKLRLQILLLNLYMDFLLITIVDKISPPRKKNLKCLKRKKGYFNVRYASGKLRLLRARNVLDSNGYKSLKWLNEMRNIIAHEYDFELGNIEKVVLKMKNKVPPELHPSFVSLNLCGKISITCILYINSLRDYVREKQGWRGIDKIKVTCRDGCPVFNVQEDSKI